MLSEVSPAGVSNSNLPHTYMSSDALCVEYTSMDFFKHFFFWQNNLLMFVIHLLTQRKCLCQPAGNTNYTYHSHIGRSCTQIQFLQGSSVPSSWNWMISKWCLWCLLLPSSLLRLSSWIGSTLVTCSQFVSVSFSPRCQYCWRPSLLSTRTSILTVCVA